MFVLSLISCFLSSCYIPRNFFFNFLHEEAARKCVSTIAITLLKMDFPEEELFQYSVVIHFRFLFLHNHYSGAVFRSSLFKM
jgi:hypothetical protein